MGKGRRTVGANTTLQIRNLGKGGVLAAGAEKVTQSTAVDTAVAALVEELESFAVVGRGLGGVITHCSVFGCFRRWLAKLTRVWLRGRRGWYGVRQGKKM